MTKISYMNSAYCKIVTCILKRKEYYFKTDEVFKCDQFEVNSKTTTNVNQLNHVLKTLVAIKNHLHIDIDSG